MSDPFEGRDIPKGALYGAAGLMLFSLAISFVGARTGMGTVHMPEAAAVETRALRFEDRPSGAVVVFDAATERPLSTVAPGTDGFVRGVLRGLMRERRLEGLPREAPFLLTRWADGRLSLRDPSTGRAVELDAFGPTNVGAFRALMDTPGTPPRAEVKP